jgi:uncharacterized Fe-S cluster protein YjdI
MTRRVYTGTHADVSYDRDVCVHSAVCIQGMPSVFDVQARPWIDPGRATTVDEVERLRSVIARCPSGALEFVEHAEAVTDSQD